MKIIDEILEMYQHHLTGDEEDADIIAFSILESMDRSDLIDTIKEMEDQELYSMVGMYMIELLKQKLGTMEVENPSESTVRRHYH